MSAIAVREAIETDLPFVIDTWVREFARTRERGVLPRDDFFTAHRVFFNEVVKREDVHALVAYLPGAEVGQEIYGYLVHETGAPRPILHFAYVTDGLRRHGVLKTLLRAAAVDPYRPFVVTCRHPRLPAIRARQEDAGRTLTFTFDPRYLRDAAFKRRHDEARRSAIPKPVATTFRRRTRGSATPRQT